MDFVQQYRAARRVSTPLVCIRTFDSSSTIRTIRGVLGDKVAENALIRWDTVHGCQHLTERGGKELTDMLSGNDPDTTLSLARTLQLAEVRAHSDESELVTIFICNAHMFWVNEPAVIQGIWNLRDLYKSNASMLILLVPPGQTVPAELTNDILVLDEPLPTRPELSKIITDTFHFAKWEKPEGETLERAVDALVGVPSFAAEQSTAMSMDLTSKQISLPDLWQHKREVISQTPGLTLFEGLDSLESIGGLESIKAFLVHLMHGKKPPSVIIFTDEIEKAFAGTGTDLSGVKTELTGGILQWTEDKSIDGILLLGVPGVGKSAIGKATSATYKRPFIGFDVAAMQGGIIGTSGANLRTAQKTVEAISEGNILWIATCNSITALPPELRSRFKLGTFFFDVPTAEERAAIWTIYREKYQIPASDPNPLDHGWTGREIKECAYKAYRFGITLTDAAAYVVPVTISSKEQIEGLRQSANGKYLSASLPGLYNYQKLSDVSAPKAASEKTGRALKFTEEE